MNYNIVTNLSYKAGNSIEKQRNLEVLETVKGKRVKQ